MGTRADFYVGCGPDAVWLGSVAWDGYEWAEDAACALRLATTEQTFRKAVSAILASRGDATTPDQGWPWPWANSGTTDYAYYFHDGNTRFDDRTDWPDMSTRQNVTFGARSGIVVIGVK